uniref:L-lactate dehydrogenase complex protein LldG n=1 Tax=Candidatus Kentrum sp. MB TaxID=2138164 RepID=A0A450XF27_9GAMM|nr:MAG: L-lactate dehydrogenase complex protein LldG [Candidatus Kentron sp. MB]VFK27896.1 MAG: L-lactate dehydrogenase complex protein LldG [Candidatus Kentron sp. MB]VFK74454.1 MAG: L-lactate dehydrogenase complex protein LldG [Candidatus Kentron sp. MB]
MNNARDSILARVGAGLAGRNDLSTQSHEALEKRLSSPPATPRPTLSESDLIRRFVTKMEAVAGEVMPVSGMEAVPWAVLDYLDRHELPHDLVATGEPVLNKIPWSNLGSKQVTLHHRVAMDADRVSLTGAFAAIAETGTLVLVSGEQTPTTLNFLPEHHLVILPQNRMVPYLEDAWQEIRRVFGPLPRAINLITGPSRTADIEQTMQLGAHGPRRLGIILVEQAPMPEG